MSETSTSSQSAKVRRDNPLTGRPGPCPKPARDGDKKQARARVNHLIASGRLPKPNDLPCTVCGHVWSVGARRHEYHHHHGYGAAHHQDVVVLCSACHAAEGEKAKQTHCKRGHKFTPENTRRKSNGTRLCVECRRQRERSRKRPEGYWKAVNERRKRRG